MIKKIELKEYERILSVIQKNNQPYRQQIVGARRSVYVTKPMRYLPVSAAKIDVIKKTTNM